jgi:hypothetical protein
MALLRDAQARAKRIDLAYFRKSHPFRRWKFVLSIALPAAGALWIAAVAAQGDERIYTSGPVSTRHSMLETQCSSCHTSSWASRYTDPAGWQAKLDAACLACHDGPVHHANATALVRGGASSNCSSCHVEHEGASRLARVGDRHCTSCHADLRTTGPEPHPAACPAGAGHAVHPRIRSFSDGHPEFAALAKKAADPSIVAFNHAVHLGPDTPQKRELLQSQLKALAGRRGVEKAADGSARLACAYCHEAPAPGAMMAPVHFESHCRDCHGMSFKGEKLPHVTPQEVRDFLRSRLAKEKLTADDLAVQVNVEAETQVYESDPNSCQKCHKVDRGDVSPEAPPPALKRTGLRPGGPGREGTPRRWFVHSTFDHGTHRELRCTECHAGAETSKLTSDLLLPTQASCLRCHSPQGGVSAACVTCHTFHDKSRDRAGDGRLRIGEVVK